MKDKMGPVGLLVAAIVAWLAWDKNSTDQGRWTGYYYPDRNQLSRHIESPANFKTLDECRQWVDATFRQRGGDEPFDFECGLDCQPRDGFNVCKETRR